MHSQGVKGLSIASLFNSRLRLDMLQIGKQNRLVMPTRNGTTFAPVEDHIYRGWFDYLQQDDRTSGWVSSPLWPWWSHWSCTCTRDCCGRLLRVIGQQPSHFLQPHRRHPRSPSRGCRSQGCWPPYQPPQTWQTTTWVCLDHHALPLHHCWLMWDSQAADSMATLSLSRSLSALCTAVPSACLMLYSLPFVSLCFWFGFNRKVQLLTLLVSPLVNCLSSSY